MKKLVVKKLIYAVLMSLVVMLFAACGSDGNKAATATKTTVMVYIEGTDLEDYNGAATGNIEEMLAAYLPPHLNVVLTTGAGTKEQEYDPVKSWKTVKRHQISYNGQKNKNETVELADLGNIDMGDPKVLTDFIVWGQTAFPADKYVLIFWDHGGGPNGGFGGYTDTESTLSLSSKLSISGLQRAIGDAVDKTGKKFEVIGFDACLMASIELAYCLKPYAKYMVASEEIEPGGGWDYTSFLNAIAVNPAADGLAIGKAIADNYAAKVIRDSIKQNGPEGVNESYTLSVVELSQIDGVMAAITQLSEAISRAIEPTVLNPADMAGFAAWNLLADVRNHSDEYSEDYVNRIFNNLIDIGHFAQLLGAVTDESWHPPAKALQNSIQQAVKYNVVGAEHEASTGLSIFFPFKDFEKAQVNMITYSKTMFSLQYYQAMRWFMQLPLTYPPGDNFTVTAPVSSGANVGVNVTSLYGIAESYVGILASGADDDEYLLLGMDLAESSQTGPNNYTLSYTRDNRCFTLWGQPVTAFFEAKMRDGRYVMSLPMYYREGSSGSSADNRPINLKVYYDPETNIGELKNIWEGIMPEGTVHRVDVDLTTGDYLTPVLLKVDIASGDPTYVLGEEIKVTDDLNREFSRTLIPAGSYGLAFQVRDLAGNDQWSADINYEASAIDGIAAKAAAPVQLPPTFLSNGFWSGLK